MNYISGKQVSRPAVFDHCLLIENAEAANQRPCEDSHAVPILPGTHSAKMDYCRGADYSNPLLERLLVS
jgi:hypothetical protein